MSSSCVQAEPRRTLRGQFILWPSLCDVKPSIHSGLAPGVPPLPALDMAKHGDDHCILPFSSPLSEKNGENGLQLAPKADAGCQKRPTVAALTSHLEDVRKREVAVLERESKVSAREEQITSREAELFEKDLEQTARDKFLRSVTAAQQEAEAELRVHEAEVAQREKALKERLERSALEVRALEAERARAWAAIQEVQAQSMECMAQMAATVQEAGCAQAGAEGGNGTASELEALRKEVESLRVSLAAKDLEAQSARVKATADALHSSEMVAELREARRRAEEEAAAERARAEEAMARLSALLPKPAPAQQECAGEAQETTDGDVATSCEPLVGSLEARLQSACKLAEKRDALARWEVSLAAREKALSDAEWRLEAERLTVAGASKTSQDGSGIPPHPPRPGVQSGLPSAWGYRQVHVPAVAQSQGFSSWVRQLTGCGLRRMQS